MPYPLIKRAKLTESQVIKIWQHQLLDRAELATGEGESIKIIYPGRTNDGRGADFRDAVIASSKGVIKGDIEVHVKSSAWQGHRHHHDPAYNRVILHVVMWRDTEEATSLQNGETVPVLALNECIKSPIGRLDREYSPASFSMSCFGATGHMPEDTVAEVLDAAGRERFLAKISRFQVDSAQTEVSQCLYQGIMGALGYSKNKLSCQELARRVPLRILESITQGETTAEECLARQQALLLGTAGLLPSQRRNRHQADESDDKWANKLEGLWASFRQTEAMSRDDWHLFRVRPINSPVRRIAAISYLVLRYKRKGILEGLADMVKEAPLIKGHIRLERGLLVAANGYWASRFDFGLPGGIRISNLLGGGRAADIAVNVLLPFMVAWSDLGSQPELERKAFALYRSYPRLTANTVERHMMHQLGLSSGLVNSAVRQQGLIHIYNSLCIQGRCDCCPLGVAADHRSQSWGMS